MTSKHVVTTERCGPLNVYVQGELVQQEKKAIFLTVHDMGSNHTAFHNFVDHPCMTEIKERSLFIHVDVPGQEDNAADLPDSFTFPTMQMLGEDLVTILDQLHVKYVVGLGEGAGANILARFGMAHPSRVLGLILLHCTSTVAGVMETFKDKIMNWKLTNIGMHPTAEQYLVFHKFGSRIEAAENKESVIKEYQEKLQKTINPRNLRRFIQAFLNRTDLSGQLAKNLHVEVLLVTGSKASHIHTVHTMHGSMNKEKSSLLKVDNVGDVLQEAPEKFAQSLLLFCKGIGLLTSVTMPGVERQRTASTDVGLQRQRTISMEEYDVPNIRRFSIGVPTPKAD